MMGSRGRYEGTRARLEHSSGGRTPNAESAPPSGNDDVGPLIARRGCRAPGSHWRRHSSPTESQRAEAWEGRGGGSGGGKTDHEITKARSDSFGRWPGIGLGTSRAMSSCRGVAAHGGGRGGARSGAERRASGQPQCTPSTDHSTGATEREERRGKNQNIGAVSGLVNSD
ncbi:hypothetical protein WOLCODRAFT_151342 [Wolfiporia cocos MD-104 SS10]|uniref:Uncharacterized protein n=1 Tax=Wolfiporia cocos (strain MD-104) TaxID=742152 RepID=A0A2H3JGI9_WOLCO|nr:hypothetical protein WOLCODRAFT_151342 [Wolfiporia cocos MD-104 SS10]